MRKNSGRTNLSSSHRGLRLGTYPLMSDIKLMPLNCTEEKKCKTNKKQTKKKLLRPWLVLSFPFNISRVLTASSPDRGPRRSDPGPPTFLLVRRSPLVTPWPCWETGTPGSKTRCYRTKTETKKKSIKNNEMPRVQEENWLQMMAAILFSWILWCSLICLGGLVSQGSSLTVPQPPTQHH